mgnify:CR=1 FL=1
MAKNRPVASQPSKVRTVHLARKKAEGEPIVMVTAYDYPSARLVDAAGVDVILVGDSLGTAVLGFDTTLSVTLEHMIHHAAAVRRGTRRAMVVVDMPFMTHRISPEETLRNAARLMQEGGAEAVKLEGGTEISDTVRQLVTAGIPVMGHIGLTPQSLHQMGGYRIQGRNNAQVERLLAAAHALAEAGAFAIVLELMPSVVGRQISEAVGIPTIGIGAGSHCDGQVLVLHDLLGIASSPKRFVKQYADLEKTIRGAVERYASEVRARRFPSRKHSFPVPEK